MDDRCLHVDREHPWNDPHDFSEAMQEALWQLCIVFENRDPEVFENRNDPDDIRPPITLRNIRAAGRALIELADALGEARAEKAHTDAAAVVTATEPD